jgi:hypothetical protein
MVRYPSKFVTGSFTEIQQAGFGRNLDAILTLLDSYTIGGVAVWTRVATITGDCNASGYDNQKIYIYHSVGDPNLGTGANKGDTDIWVGLMQIKTTLQDGSWSLYCGVARDVEPGAVVVKNHVSQWFTDHAYATNTVASTGAATSKGDTWNWYGVINPYEFIWYAKDAGSASYGFIHVSSLRPACPPKFSGVARITSNVGTTFDVDRDITASITVGQPVWLFNQTPDGAALQSVTIEPHTVVACSATQIQVNAPLVNAYAAGSLIGYDIAIITRIGTSTDFLANATILTGVTGVRTHRLHAPSTSSVLAVTESDYDPEATLNYLGSLAFVRDIDDTVTRGIMDFCKIFALNAQVVGDYMVTVDGSRYLCIAQGSPANWITGYGPGST